MKPTQVIISSGNYNTRNYKRKNFVNLKSALKYAKSYGYMLNELMNCDWSYYGQNHKIRISNN